MNTHHGFPNSGKGGGIGNVAWGEFFLPVGENLRRSDFDDSNLFQS